MIDSRLRTLVCLTEKKHFTKTAETLFITQPAVSQHVKSLEKEFGIKLFHNLKTFKLTAAGCLIYEYAKKAIAQYEQLGLVMSNNFKSFNSISFAVTRQVSFSLLGPVLKKWFINNPKEQINLVVDRYKEITNKLDDGSIDFAIVDNNYDKTKYEGVYIYKASIVLTANSYNRLAKKEKIKIEQLKTENVILDSIDSSIRKKVLEEFQKLNINVMTYTKLMEINEPHIIKDLVLHNIGVGFFYLPAIKKELSEKIFKVIELIGIDIKQDFYLIYNIDNLLKSKFIKIAEEMIRFAKEEWHK